MATDLFNRLAEMEVPPPPAQFDAQLHDRVNRSLLTQQLVDLIVHGMPWTFFYFARAMVAVVTYTVTGRYELASKDKKDKRR